MAVEELVLEPAPAPAPDHSGEIAGFWRRWFAFAVDGLFLGAVGACLGFLFYDELVRLGGWGTLIGFVIAFVYFGLWNSRLAKGQTPGEVLMNIKVVGRDGAPLSIARSFLRSLVFSGPYFMNGAAFSVDVLQNIALVVVLSVLVFGVGLSDAYLFTFNRRTRQTLHDLAASSFVVRSVGPLTPPLNLIVWRAHFAVVAVIFILSLAAPIVGQHFVKTEPFARLMSLDTTLSNRPSVQRAMVNAGSTTFSSTQKGTRTTTNLVVHLTIDPLPADKELFADNIAREIFATYPDAEKKDVVVVELGHGFDIGIASWWWSEGYSHSPAQWHQRLDPKPDGATAPADGEPNAAAAKT
jgi:uncharacterized RDD family membrane protein YckC